MQSAKTELTSKAGVFGKKEKLILREAEGDGDCAFHAIFGEWDKEKSKLFCLDVTAKRAEMAQKLKECPSKDNELYKKLKKELIEWIRDKNISGGEQVKAARKKYKKLELAAKIKLKKKWKKAKSELIKYNETPDAIKGKSTRKIFHKLMVGEDQSLAKFIEDNLTLKGKIDAYNTEAKKRLRWDPLITPELIDEYLEVRIKQSKVFLTNSEIGLIADIFKLHITLHTNETKEIYNGGYKGVVDIQFDGINHFDRILSDKEFAILRIKSDRTWPIDQAPFVNYQSLAYYYSWLKALSSYSDKAKIEYDNLKSNLLKHIQEMVRTDGIILDFVYLVECNESEITTHVFDGLATGIKGKKSPIHLLDAIALACHLIRSTKQKTPLTFDLISLLKNLVNLNIEEAQQLQVFSPKIISHALYATSALLECLYERLEHDDHNYQEEGVNEYIFKELKVIFEDLQKNIEIKRAEFPWHYYLCSRAQNTLEAMGEVSTATQNKERHKQGGKNIVLALYHSVKGTGQVSTGTAALVVAIVATGGSYGGAAPTLVPACIAFGAGWYGGFVSSIATLKHIKQAYKYLHHEKGKELGDLEQNSYEKIQTSLSVEEWDEIKKHFTEVFNARDAKEWGDIDAMNAVYYFSELALRVELPDDWIKSIQGLFATLYIYNISTEHVRNFIFANIKRLHNKYKEFPDLGSARASDFYINLFVNGSPLYQKYLPDLDGNKKKKELSEEFKKLPTSTKDALKKHHSQIKEHTQAVREDIGKVITIRTEEMMMSAEKVPTETNQPQLKDKWQRWLPQDIECYKMYQFSLKKDLDEEGIQAISDKLKLMAIELHQPASLSLWGKLCLDYVVKTIGNKVIASPKDKDEKRNPITLQIGKVGYQTVGAMVEAPEGSKISQKDVDLSTHGYEAVIKIHQKYPVFIEIKEIIRQHIGFILKFVERQSQEPPSASSMIGLFPPSQPSVPTPDSQMPTSKILSSALGNHKGKKD